MTTINAIHAIHAINTIHTINAINTMQSIQFTIHTIHAIHTMQCNAMQYNAIQSTNNRSLLAKKEPSFNFDPPPPVWRWWAVNPSWRNHWRCPFKSRPMWPVSIFVFFVLFALFIDLLTDKVQPLSRWHFPNGRGHGDPLHRWVLWLDSSPLHQYFCPM